MLCPFWYSSHWISKTPNSHNLFYCQKKKKKNHLFGWSNPPYALPCSCDCQMSLVFGNTGHFPGVELKGIAGSEKLSWLNRRNSVLRPWYQGETHFLSVAPQCTGSALGQVQRDNKVNGLAFWVPLGPHFFISQITSLISMVGGFRVMTQFSGCQSPQSSSSILASLHLQLLIWNVTKLFTWEGVILRSEWTPLTGSEFLI